jgi:hypothetical protein
VFGHDQTGKFRAGRGAVAGAQAHEREDSLNCNTRVLQMTSRRSPDAQSRGKSPSAQHVARREHELAVPGSLELPTYGRDAANPLVSRSFRFWTKLSRRILFLNSGRVQPLR